MDEELTDYLDAIGREQCYRVDETLKQSDHETTQKVFFVGKNGSERGPYIRKYFSSGNGAGSGYHRIHEAQRSGVRFMHIPRILEIYALDDTTEVVIMEYVEGETLESLVERTGGSVDLTIELFPSILNAVGELHRSFSPAIIHRDIKPSNIVVTGGVVTIIDFGIARSFRDDALSDTTHFGTRAYAPPEQFGFGQTDERSDVYALGMLLYFMLSGDTPTNNARENGFRTDSIPVSLSDVVKRATMIDPSDRFASVGEMNERFIEAASASKESGGAATSSAMATADPTAAPNVTYASVYADAPVARQSASSIAVPIDDVTFFNPDASSTEERGVTSTWQSRVPIIRSRGWNIIIAVIAVFFMVVAVQMTFFPEPGETMADAPILARVLAYIPIGFVLIPCICYGLCNRDRLSQRIPALARMRAKKTDVILAFSLAVVAMIVVGLSASFI